jgi:hypothetical protein
MLKMIDRRTAAVAGPNLGSHATGKAPHTLNNLSSEPLNQQNPNPPPLRTTRKRSKFASTMSARLVAHANASSTQPTVPTHLSTRRVFEGRTMRAS